jgi:hypothetical protein
LGVIDRTDLASELTRPLVSVLDSPANDAEPLRETAAVDTSAATDPGPLAGFALLAPRESQADDLPVWGNVPPRSPNFTGRTKLLGRLGECLTADGATAVLPSVLHRMGRIGKTQMAVEYIYRHLHDYDVIWWIQATQQAQVRAGLTELAPASAFAGSSEEDTPVSAVREALRVGWPFRRWLLVFHSAESPEAVSHSFRLMDPARS